MRMRKLGKGQSVVFCVPEEIRTKILMRKIKPDAADIDISDVLNWAISETWIEMQRSMPLWAVQGRRFEYQSALWADAPTDTKEHMSKLQAEKFLEKESQTIEDRYRPRSRNDVASFMHTSNTGNLDLIEERCHEFDNLNFNSSSLQEEQERELSPEIEQERQVQRPAPAQPAEHQIHPDLLKFVATGKLVKKSQAYKPAFKSLRNTSAAAHLDVSQFPPGLLVTADFAGTVQISGASYLSDMYQRPVQWILTDSGDSALTANTVSHILIVSPHEAQELIPELKKSKTVSLHLYAPRPNSGFRALDGLDLYTIPARPVARTLPSHLVVQLNLFAGQLYLSSFKEYIEICTFLGLAWNKAEEGCVVAADGFIVNDGSDGRSSRSSFSDSPVKFLKMLMTKIRRNCEGIDKTHMGMILDGRLLRPSDFGEADDKV